MIRGGQGNDQLRGGSGSDVLLGNEGDDSLYGGVGTDLLVGGLGSDKIHARDGEVDFLVVDNQDEVDKDEQDILL